MKIIINPIKIIKFVLKLLIFPMSKSEQWKWVYKVVRSVLFTTIAFVAFIVVSLYLLLSIPAVQRNIRDVAEKELSTLFTSRVEIGNVTIRPFNEVIVNDVVLYEPSSDVVCIKVDKLGAGISLWNLIRNRRIIITYAELISPDIRVRQDVEHGPLNIQFLIDAFAPKDKNKPPKLFDLRICNVVIRKGKGSFDKMWCRVLPQDNIDFNHLKLSSLNADLNIPRLSNDDMQFDLRRLAFTVAPGFKIEKIAANVSVANGGDIDIKDLIINLRNTRLTFSDVSLPIKTSGGFNELLNTHNLNVKLQGENVTPSEFSPFFTPLNNISNRFDLSLEIEGSIHNVSCRNLAISEQNGDMALNLADVMLTPDVDSLSRIAGVKSLKVGKLDVFSSATFNRGLATALVKNLPQNIIDGIGNAGKVELSLRGDVEPLKKSGSAEVSFLSGYGNFDLGLDLLTDNRQSRLNLKLESEGIDMGNMLSNKSIGKIALLLNGNFDFDSRIFNKGYLTGIIKSKGILDSKLKALSSMVPHGDLYLNLPSAEINGYSINDVVLQLEKEGSLARLDIESEDDNFRMDISGEYLLAGENSHIMLDGMLDRCRPGIITGKDIYGEDVIKKDGNALTNLIISGDLDINLYGNSINSLAGVVQLSDISLENIKTGKRLVLNKFDLEGGIEEETGERYYAISSDWIAGEIHGDFTPQGSVGAIRDILAGALPNIIPPGSKNIDNPEQADFRFTIFRHGEWMDYLNLPVRLLYEATVSGRWDSESDILDLKVSAPYIQQGKDKLIQHSALDLSLCNGIGKGSVYSSLPTKKGVLDLGVDLKSTPALAEVMLHFNPGSDGAFYGDMMFEVSERNILNSAGRELQVKMLPSDIYLNNTKWEVGEADIRYTDKRVNVEGFSISNGNQYINIFGVASPSMDDEVRVILQDIDLNYVFDTLNIEVAQFGGNASGVAVGKGLLSPKMEAFTERMHVENLSYNQCVLGDGELRGDFDIKKKRVGIFADIREKGRYAATVDGGIWIGKDSLSFNFDADKVRVGFLQYFMKAFSSHVDGRASGKALLYGTFKDVNMKGRMLADSVAIKVDYSNVTYSGSDSIIIDPGKIEIPRFELHDMYGNKGYLTGLLEHDNFHNPEFDFRISDADHLLLYDTNAEMNPIWYGRVFGTGTGRIVGDEQYIRLIADMTTEENTEFTFVLDDAKEAVNYQFLTFTDKRKESIISEQVVTLSEPDEIVKAFNKKIESEAGPPSVFAMDIRATITPAAKLTMVMDPAAGDKIIARGEGPIYLGYNTESDDLRMYGKYTLSEGTYNFSLQDIILKDFIIKEGSSISFNGDPMAAILNIRGAYRVNTNLTDLDASFATDKDLNRVNVPVDAMLLVTGDLESPDIKFDIELPTLNAEIEQKVRSIISTDEMMNMQMIYLLALNRFYTPDYSGNANTGGEWASVASSTISSQLQNILGQLTDKVTVAPSLRSDKGDFSDLQVDVALSSRLFNNRLLINGNFGYRDPSTSSTTFIGDFDLEYLLNRSGNFRLKAYNHFNDQNYYLKSALTTQGLGIVWRKDFDTLFPKKSQKAAPDTITTEK